jgi:predicted ATPase
VRVNHIELANWKNFKAVNLDLPDRVFLVGPNASGKSNFLDAFRFLRDIVLPGGGLQKACSDRGGVSKIRCLAARQYPEVAIAAELAEGDKRVMSLLRYGALMGGTRKDINSSIVQRRSVSPSAMAGVRWWYFLGEPSPLVA